jgi:hypothetical protein
MFREVPTTHQGAVMALLLPALKDRVSVAGQSR